MILFIIFVILFLTIVALFAVIVTWPQGRECPSRPVETVESGRWFWKRGVDVHEPHCWHGQVVHRALWYEIHWTCCQCGAGPETRPIHSTLEVQRKTGVPFNDLHFVGYRTLRAEIPHECRYEGE